MANNIRKHKIEDIPSHLKMVMASISAYANDGKYSHEEIERILEIALADGTIDDDEKRVLQHVFARAKEKPLTKEVNATIESLSQQYLSEQ